ncbi:MAG TPA: D-glycero-beta-D-manno-heptose 1-phosphate adenylyltransferase [Verrucomicrobiota bacterium]|nr:D-glycero-beta-D-manno-heptose 1-phosphate adenylyltransferase [Verrucomicrobiota bacterium]
MSSADKILSGAALETWRSEMRTAGKRLVVTNGCFDLLHAGHVAYLESARALGDILLIGLNGDDSVRQLKGSQRPLNTESDRARVLAALGCVDGVFVFPEMRATNFLQRVQPDIYVKGGDYTLDTIDQDERRAVENGGGRIAFLPFVPGKSTSGLLEKIQNL